MKHACERNRLKWGFSYAGFDIFCLNETGMGGKGLSRNTRAVSCTFFDVHGEAIARDDEI